MIALATGQAALMQASAVDLVMLVHLTTYSDREALTVSKEFWFSSPHPVRYAWGGTARDFADVVDRVSFDSSGFAHLPEPAAARPARARVALLAETIDGANLWKTLSSENLLAARVEIATLLVSPGHLRNAAAFWDLGAAGFAGTEHVVRFRGVLSGAPEVSDELVALEFETEDPQPAWLRALDATQVDPRDLGRRYPLPFGAAKGVPCINRVVGWYTTLAQPLTTTQTGNVKVGDLAGAPAGSATYQIGPERVTATKVDDATLDITARGVSGTGKVLHNPGEPVLEVVSSTVLVVSAKPIEAIDALYVVNQATGERVRVTTPYTVDLSNNAVDGGEYVSTVTFTADQLQQLLDAIEPAPTASLQTVLIPLNTYSDQATGDNINNNSVAASKLVEGSVSGTDERLRAAVTGSADIPDPESRNVVRWRVKVECTGKGDEHTYLNYRYNAFGNSTSSGTRLYDFKLNAEETVTLTGPWITPSSAQTLAAALSDYVEFWLEFVGSSGSNDDYVTVDTTWLEVEVEGTDTPASPAHGAAQGGLGLLFVADVRGVPARAQWASFSSGYTFNEGTGWSVLNGTQTDLGASGQKLSGLADGQFSIAMQRQTTSGTIDLTAPASAGAYRLAVTADNASKIQFIDILITDKTGSGTGVPNPYRNIRFLGSGLVEDTEVELENDSAWDVGGTPLLSDIETIQVSMFLSNTGSPAPSITVRLLERRNAGSTALAEGHEIARWFVEEMAGEEFDSSSLSALDTALGGIAFAGQFDAYGETVADVMAGLGFDLRTNFRRSPIDGKWRAYAATLSSGNYTYPAAVRTLTMLDALRESLKALAELAATFRGYYALRRWLSPSDPASYGAVSESASGTDWTNAKAALGALTAEPLLFLGIEASATASDVLGFYAHERRRASARRWAVSVALWEGYDLEPGDTVALRPRWRDADAKARVLETLLGSGEAAVGLVLEEVE